ncbi:hypothetical protein KY358_00545 [Candidatus Woesearchaeota archaeon]|nr:hypothetical protein [Candidatus Woesearchaeota archaeon]
MRLIKELEQANTFVVVVPEERYSSQTLSFAKTLSRLYSRICYISATRLYSTFSRELRDTRGFMFLDLITKTVEDKPNQEKNCIFLKAPYSLDSLNSELKKVIRSFRPEIIVIDSFSSLSMFNPYEALRRFAVSLIRESRRYNSKLLFLFASPDRHSGLMRGMSTLADRVVEA